jgi:hypothetical protein
MTRVLRAARSNEGSVSIVHGSFSAGVRLNFRTTTASIPVAALNAVSVRRWLRSDVDIHCYRVKSDGL